MCILSRGTYCTNTRCTYSPPRTCGGSTTGGGTGGGTAWARHGMGAARHGQRHGRRHGRGWRTRRTRGGRGGGRRLNWRSPALALHPLPAGGEVLCRHNRDRGRGVDQIAQVLGGHEHAEGEAHRADDVVRGGHQEESREQGRLARLHGTGRRRERRRRWGWGWGLRRPSSRGEPAVGARSGRGGDGGGLKWRLPHTAPAGRRRP